MAWNPDEDDLQEAFNKESKPLDKRDALKKILPVQRELALINAVEKKDWAKALEMARQGATGKAQFGRAVDLLVEDGSLEAIKILDTLPMEQEHDDVLGYALETAATKGSVDAVKYLLQKKLEPEAILTGLRASLDSKGNPCTDILFSLAEEGSLDDHTMGALLARRPDLHKQAEERDLAAHRNSAVLTTLHAFGCACADQDIKTAEKMLPLLKRALKQENDFMLRARFTVYSKLFTALQTKDVNLIKKTFKEYPLPEEYTYHFLGAALKTDDKNIVALAIDIARPDHEDVDIALMPVGKKDNIPVNSLLCLIEKIPAYVAENRADIGKLLIAAEDKEAFANAVKSKKLALPTTSHEREEMMLKAAEEQNPKAVALLAPRKMGTDAIDKLMNSDNPDILAFTTKKIKDIHADDDALFWCAAVHDRKDLLALFSGEKSISAENLYGLGYALQVVAEREDTALFEDILARTDWTAEAIYEALGSVSGHHPFVEKIVSKMESLGIPAMNMDQRELEMILERNPEAGRTLAFLEKKGFTLQERLTEDNYSESLSKSLENGNASGFFYFAQKTGYAQMIENHWEKIEIFATEDILHALSRHLATARIMPDRNLAEEIAGATPESLFDGKNSLALRAAYADDFTLITNKLIATNMPLPADKLLQTKDEYGNSVLDILAEHKTLNTLMRIELWKDQDAASFLQKNLSAAHFATCDFNGLNAGLAQMRLKEQANKGGFRIKKGPDRS